jgi:hypothetical protein
MLLLKHMLLLLLMHTRARAHTHTHTRVRLIHNVVAVIVDDVAADIFVHMLLSA